MPKIFLQKSLDKPKFLCYNNRARNGRLAQLGEHLPYKQRVTGSSPVLSTKGKFEAKKIDSHKARLEPSKYAKRIWRVSSLCEITPSPMYFPPN